MATRAILLVSLAFLFLAGLLATSLAVANNAYSQPPRTPIPTAENPDEFQNLQELFSDENCVHPCWLDLILGETT